MPRSSFFAFLALSFTAVNHGQRVFNASIFPNSEKLMAFWPLDLDYNVDDAYRDLSPLQGTMGNFQPVNGPFNTSNSALGLRQPCTSPTPCQLGQYSFTPSNSGTYTYGVHFFMSSNASSVLFRFGDVFQVRTVSGNDEIAIETNGTHIGQIDARLTRNKWNFVAVTLHLASRELTVFGGDGFGLLRVPEVILQTNDSIPPLIVGQLSPGDAMACFSIHAAVLDQCEAVKLYEACRQFSLERQVNAVTCSANSRRFVAPRSLLAFWPLTPDVRFRDTVSNLEPMVPAPAYPNNTKNAITLFRSTTNGVISGNNSTVTTYDLSRFGGFQSFTVSFILRLTNAVNVTVIELLMAAGFPLSLFKVSLDTTPRVLVKVGDMAESELFAVNLKNNAYITVAFDATSGIVTASSTNCDNSKKPCFASVPTTVSENPPVLANVLMRLTLPMNSLMACLALYNISIDEGANFQRVCRTQGTASLDLPEVLPIVETTTTTMTRTTTTSTTTAGTSSTSSTTSAGSSSSGFSTGSRSGSTLERGSSIGSSSTTTSDGSPPSSAPNYESDLSSSSVATLVPGSSTVTSPSSSSDDNSSSSLDPGSISGSSTHADLLTTTATIQSNSGLTPCTLRSLDKCGNQAVSSSSAMWFNAATGIASKPSALLQSLFFSFPDDKSFANLTARRLLTICDDFAPYLASPPSHVGITAVLAVDRLVRLDNAHESVTLMAMLFMRWNVSSCPSDSISPFMNRDVERVQIKRPSQVWLPKFSFEAAQLDPYMLDPASFGDQAVALASKSPNTLDLNFIFTKQGFYTATCSFDLSKFPFDKQSCDFSFSLSRSVTLVSFSDTLALCPYGDFTEWTFTNCSSSTGVKMSGGSSVSVVTFSVAMKRKSTYYLVNMVLPTGLLGFINAATFLLPRENPDRPIFAITLLLSLNVAMTQVLNNVPVTSSRILLSDYILCLVALASCVTLYHLVACFAANRNGSNIKRQSSVIFVEIVFAIIVMLVFTFLNIYVISIACNS